ncbi:type II CRISPR RNA-guided endonuclease Cas9 [Clostridium chrysemydis]|uniref:type II CRISPR RNA-guided endonuclease Cas9 n=1 Tax=Clostridium chrysemydis TaxID=2665504 RepID=UPI003F2FA2BE
MGYSIGIDLGTNSCAIAVLDEKYKLKKVKGKNLWGVIKFDEGKTAEGRRLKRNTRRLNIRRKNRIILLRNLLEEEIMKKDATFFQRLEESFLQREDKSNEYNKKNLFIEDKFNDRHFYQKYPTIYHLRKELVYNKKQYDIRLVYLAIHHLIKYRGNFLYEGQTFSNVLAGKEKIVEELINYISDEFEININSKIDNITSILESDKSKSDKVFEIIKLEKYSKEEKKVIKEIFNGILGLQIKMKNIFKDAEFGDFETLKLSDEEIDDKYKAIEEIIGEKIKLLELIKSLYSQIQLEGILGNNKYISEAMIQKYNKFGDDLKILKKIIINNFERQDYIKIFKDNSEGEINFSNYMNHKIKGKKTVSDQRSLFYNYILEKVENIESEEAEYIRKSIEKEDFLIRLNTTINSVIPYQVHEKELIEIIDNQGVYYPILKENKDKIIKILTFRIPYYVGPLNKFSKFSWFSKVEGKELEKIYPWNFEEVVDIDKSAEEFITKMTSYCSYIPSERVLPINSILYSEYCYYNEINKVKFNNKFLDSKYKEILKEEIFMNQNEVTESTLEKWYKQKFVFDSKEVNIQGVMGDKKVNASLKPIRDFTRIFGDINKKNIELIERIIYWLTVFEDKKIVKRKLDLETHLNNEIKKEILKLNYRGWGKLSKKLLCGIKNDRGVFNETIIDVLKKTNLNFMQIINSDKYDFNKLIDKENNTTDIEKFNYKEHIQPLQGSPALKRGIWQATKQIEEVIKLIGKYPNNIYIEVAREDRESKRTLARNKKMLELYSNIENVESIDKDIIKFLKDKSNKIDNERLYLYLEQRGKCMYSGEALCINDLHLYHVDHIIPRSIIKDDSLSNKVLVKSKMNEEKSNGSLQDNIVKNMQKYWEGLLKNRLISQKKYNNLINSAKPFSEEMEHSFINRQLVEVRQITKHIVNLLNRRYKREGTSVYCIKTELVNNFKKQFNIMKSREINDFHHAKDAYAVGVLGEYIQNRFRSMIPEFIYEEYKYDKKYREKKEKNKYGYIISSMLYDYKDFETNKLIWNSKEELSKIMKIFKYNDCIVTRKTEIMDGQMFKVTINPKPKNKKLSEGKIPIKNNNEIYLNPEKYGYYEGIEQSYYSIIEFIKNNKRVKRLAGVPIMYAKGVNRDREKLKKYFESIGYKEVKIIKECIPKYQKIRYEGDEFYIVSPNEWCNAKQLKVRADIYDNICHMNTSKDVEKTTKDKNINLDEIYEYLIMKIKKEYKIYKSAVEKLENKREVFKNLKNGEKLQVINEILKLTKTDSQCANLKLLKDSNRVGRIEKRSNTDIEKITFIYESVTGVNSKEVKY